MTSAQLINGLELGLLYSLVAMAVYLTFRVINFADLTVDGSFPLGAAVMAVLLSKGWHVAPALAAAFASGMAAGAFTGYLNVHYKIMEILAGILVMTALYSINLRVMGRPNIALMDLDLSINFVRSTMLATVACVMIGLVWFLHTELGLAVRAIGQNPLLASSLGINVGRMKILGLSLSNGLVALSGGLFAMMQGFADIGIGTGTIIVGLASVIIGEKLLNSRSITLAVIACLCGSIAYRLTITFALNLDVLRLEPSDLNLVSSGLVTLALALPLYYKKIRG